MPTTRKILQRIVDQSGLSLRAFAREYGEWDVAYLTRSLDGTKTIGPAVIGRLLMRLDVKTAAELIRAYLNEQKQLIEVERKRFAAGSQGKAREERTGKAASTLGTAKRRGARGAAPE